VADHDRYTDPTVRRADHRGLNTPTAVEPAGDTIWIAERGTGNVVPIPNAEVES
jgi:hypothetical protein